MRILIALFLALLPVVSNAKLVWEKTVIDFGVIREDCGVASRAFKFNNAGLKSEEIIRVVTSCGCTTIKGAKRKVRAGARDSLAVSYNPAGRPGAFDKSVRVITGDSIYQLHIIGNVIPSDFTVKQRFPVRKENVALSCGTLAFEELELFSRRTIRFFGCNLSDKALPLRIEGLPANSTYSISPDTVAPGCVFAAAVTFTAFDADFGMHRYYPKLVAGEMVHEMEMMVTVESPSDYDVSEFAACKIADDRVAFVGYGKSKQARADLTLENAGKADLLIRGIATELESLSVESTFPMVVKPGEKACLKFVLDSNKEKSDILNSILVIYTNDPRNPNKRVRLVGTK